VQQAKKKKQASTRGETRGPDASTWRSTLSVQNPVSKKKNNGTSCHSNHSLRLYRTRSNLLFANWARPKNIMLSTGGRAPRAIISLGARHAWATKKRDDHQEKGETSKGYPLKPAILVRRENQA